ncbi:MAG: DUF1492 domain-containing protein [Firmicutes bacterium]|nr:DUF1492 domain-containing protein [Bacillota bacterium]
MVDLEQELQNDLDSYIQVKSEIHRVIEAVEKPKLKLILQMRYANYKKWEEIQDALDVSDLRYLFRLHNDALKEAEKNRPA